MTEQQVLIVDDDTAVRDSLEALLTLEGYRVTAFASAEAFLETHAGDLGGCLLLDVRMPGMDGLELLDNLAARGSRLPVVVMTGHGDIAMAVRAMKAGALDFLEKPIAHDRLLSVLDSAFDGMSSDHADAERDVLHGVIEGKPNKVIAYELGISPRTVEVHRAHVMSKMDADSLSQLVRMAISAGIVP
jgi:two-component system response regulator FixJ